MKKSLSVVLLLAVCACASHTGVVPMGEDTYMIARQQATGFPGLGNMKAEIIAEGTQYCAGLGKKFQIVSTQETQPPYILGNYPRVEIQFMCLAADDPELQLVELLGTEAKYTDGKISSLSGIKGEDSLMQITVPVQPGNSGGPLVTSDGYVVGLITSTAAVKYFYAITETLPQNINWAVKADYILPMLGEGDLEGSEIKIDNPVQKVSKAICLVKAE